MARLHENSKFAVGSLVSGRPLHVCGLLLGRDIPRGTPERGKKNAEAHIFYAPVMILCSGVFCASPDRRKKCTSSPDREKGHHVPTPKNAPGQRFWWAYSDEVFVGLMYEVTSSCHVRMVAANTHFRLHTFNLLWDRENIATCKMFKEPKVKQIQNRLKMLTTLTSGLNF